jgi:hypothetical protein
VVLLLFLASPLTILKGVVAIVAESSENITDPATFDTYRSLLKHHSHLKGSVMNKMLDSISSGLATQVDAAMHDIESEDQQTATSHRLPLEMYCFLLQWFVSIADEGKPTEGEDIVSVPPPTKGRRGRGGRGGAGKATGGRGQSKKAVEQWSWTDQIPAILALVSRALRLKTKRVWTSTSDLDAFVTYALLNTSLSISLTPAQMCHTTSLPCHGVRAAHEVRAYPDGCLQGPLPCGKAPWTRPCCADSNHPGPSVLRASRRTYGRAPECPCEGI